MKTTVIVGAGHAGSQCAISLRAEGYDGKIVLINDDADVPYHKPPLSKKYLASDSPEATPLRAFSAYEKADVDWIHSAVESIDTANNAVSLPSGETIAYDHLVLATGARNRQLPDLNACSNVYSLRTLDDAGKLHSALSSANEFAVLGGGFIGLEVAACLAALGRTVTVIEASDRLLGRVVAEAVSRRVKQGLSEMGVRVLTGCVDTRFEFSAEPSTTNTLTGLIVDIETIIRPDALLVGIGAIPNTQIAHEAGIVCDNGIAVNEYLKTSHDNVFAIGDCANFPHWQTASRVRLESVQNAVDQAKCLAKTITTQTPINYRTVPWFWSDIGAMKLQIAGIHTGDTEQVIREEGDAFALYHLKAERVVCVESINSTKDHLLARKLIEHGPPVSAQNIQTGLEKLKDLL